MIKFQYFQPKTDNRKFIGSYYDTKMSAEIIDVMRAEITNIRFILNGKVYSDINGSEECFRRGEAILCGPTFSWSNVKFSADAHVFGAAITPMGWSRMFKIEAYKLADRVLPLEEIFPNITPHLLKEIHLATNDKSRVCAADNLFASLIHDVPKGYDGFLDEMSSWLTDPKRRGMNDLLANLNFSHRQIERLCKAYFGSAPKRLHRKFRALHAANRLAWHDLTDWKDIATMDYYDQSHFIREFKQFNGRTPSEFIKGAHILVRLTLQERLQITHESPFSLVG